MTAYSHDLKFGRYNAELSHLFVPRHPDRNRRAVIYAHGANGDGSQIANYAVQTSLTRFFQKIAAAGFVVLSADWGGPHTYGNDAELLSMEQGWDFLKASGLCADDKVILTGGSMGTLSTHRFAKEHPTWVAGINCWIPFLDVEAGRTGDWLGLREPINTAWGVPAGSFIGGVDQTPLPANAKPLDYAAAMAAIPTHMWYSTADPISANMAAYLAARPAAVGHVTSTSQGHNDAAVAGADIDAIIDFLHSVSAGSSTYVSVTTNHLVAEDGSPLVTEAGDNLIHEGVA